MVPSIAQTIDVLQAIILTQGEQMLVTLQALEVISKFSQLNLTLQPASVTAIQIDLG
jgi:alpha-L-arabinofuranosidase